MENSEYLFKFSTVQHDRYRKIFHNLPEAFGQ